MKETAWKVIAYSLFSFSLIAQAEALTTAEFYSRARLLEEGDSQKCSYPVGIYRSADSRISLKLRPISENNEYSEQLQRLKLSQAYIAESIGLNIHHPALIVRAESGWKWIDLGSHPSSPRMENILVGQFLKKSDPESVSKLPGAFLSDDSTVLKTPLTFAELKWDGVSTFKNFYSKIPKNMSNSAAYLSQTRIRVPVEFYSLLKDPSFRAAHRNRSYSKVIDLIYGKSKQLMVDPVQALTLSLIATDLRERGPCGSVYGRRGREVVPLSIFDHEESTYLEPSRLDAPQHFFGYAILTYLSNFPGTISTVSKEKDYYLPETKFFFQQLHEGSSKSSSIQTDDTRAFGVKIAGEERAKRRRRVDVDRDLFYNELGIDFGKRLQANVWALPGQVLRDSKFDKRRIEIGLFRAGYQRAWRAFDPNYEPHYILNEPNTEKFKTVQEERRAYEEKISQDITFLEFSYFQMRNPTADNPLYLLKKLCVYGPSHENGWHDQITTERFCEMYEDFTSKLAKYEKVIGGFQLARSQSE